MAYRVEKDRLSLMELTGCCLVAEMMKPSNVASRADLLGKLGKVVRQYIGESLDCDESITKIAQRSHVHANGFYRVILMDYGEFCPRVRLHHWPQDFGALEDIHSHNWPFESWILSGGYLEDTYRSADRDEGDAYVMFKTSVAHRGARSFELERYGEGWFSLCSTEVRSAGWAYGRASETLHRVYRAIEDTTTLFCTGHYVSRQSLILRKSERDTVITTPDRLSNEALTNFLTKIYQSDALDTNPVCS